MSASFSVGLLLFFTTPWTTLSFALEGPRGFLCDVARTNPSWRVPAGCNCTDPCSTPAFCGRVTYCSSSNVVRQLYLNYSNLQYLPDSISEFASLTMARLGGNSFSRIPPRWFDVVTTVTHLDVSHDNLRYLPDNLANLAGLRTLEVSWNRLTRIPGLGDRSYQLAYFFAEGNELCELPVRWYADMPELVVAPRNVHLEHNHLNCLSADVRPMGTEDTCNQSTQTPCPESVTGWTCARSQYGDGMWCDCDCGVPDPDCQTMSPLAVQCGSDGVCLNGSCVRPGWNTSRAECKLEMFGLDGLCSCGCGGLVDPDCLGARPLHAGSCEDLPFVYCNATTDRCVYPWRCSKGSYGSGDGCDCECGLPDPDCGPPGPRQSSNCSAKGNSSLVCVEGRCGATPWSCDPWLYGDNSTCNCGCGMQDSDCAPATPTQPNNCPGGDRVCFMGECSVSRSWWCDPAQFDQEAVCACACGDVCPGGLRALVDGCLKQGFNCTWNGTACPKCGNGHVEFPLETCDGAGEWCVQGECTCAPPYGPTTPASDHCEAVCNDAQLAPGEECDSTPWCQDNCTCPERHPFLNATGRCSTCGDGVLDRPREDCEGTPYCDNVTCKCESGHAVGQGGLCGFCGNGIVEVLVQGEECDGTIWCSNETCTCPEDHPAAPGLINVCSGCGNGVTDSGEQCDGGAGCSNDTCKCLEGFVAQSPPTSQCARAKEANEGGSGAAGRWLAPVLISCAGLLLVMGLAVAVLVVWVRKHGVRERPVMLENVAQQSQMTTMVLPSCDGFPITAFEGDSELFPPAALPPGATQYIVVPVPYDGAAGLATVDFASVSDHTSVPTTSANSGSNCESLPQGT